MVGMGASTDWKANDEARRNSARSNMNRDTHHSSYSSVQINRFDRSICGANPASSYSFTPFFGKKSIRARENKRKKKPGMRFSTSDVLHEIPIPPYKLEDTM